MSNSIGIQDKFLSLSYNYMEKSITIEELREKANSIFYHEFYLMCLTLTVVGYGDSVSMPDLSTYKSDYQWLLLSMLAGLFGFS